MVVEEIGYGIVMNFDVYEEMEAMDLRMSLLEQPHYDQTVEGRFPFMCRRGSQQNGAQDGSDEYRMRE